MSEEEVIFNLKTEIEKYAIPKTQLQATVKNNSYPVRSSGIITYITDLIDDLKNNYIVTELSSYLTKNDASNTYLSKTDATSTYLSKTDATSTYLKKTDAQSGYATKNHTHNFNANMYATAINTTTKVDQLTDPGYYHYQGTDANFTCDPDIIHYTNGFIKVEAHNDHIIQHVYATSYSSANQTYILDGREFVRYGYISNNSKVWNKWYVSHIPWKERTDLISEIDANVSTNGFQIYECTAGYVFKWQQAGEEQKYVLPMTQYNYNTICIFTKPLPIHGPHLYGNLIGHMDVKITENEFKIRSTNKKGEYLVGVEGSYFVPRTN